MWIIWHLHHKFIEWNRQMFPCYVFIKSCKSHDCFRWSKIKLVSYWRFVIFLVPLFYPKNGDPTSFTNDQGILNILFPVTYLLTYWKPNYEGRTWMSLKRHYTNRYHCSTWGNESCKRFRCTVKSPFSMLLPFERVSTHW